MFLALALAPATPVHAAEDYPNRPVRVIVPYPAGGVTDIFGRLVAEELRKSLGQPVIVDNRPGGVTMIGAEAVARSKPDGYTLLMTTSIPIVNTVVFKKTPYTVSDFTPVAGIAKTPNVLTLHPSVPAQNLRELVAYAKANPDKLNSAILGTGSIVHLIAERFAFQAGLKLTHVPYRGDAPAVTDLLAGHVQIYFASIGTVAQHLRAGTLRGIAVTGEERSSGAPDVPTFREAGYPDMVSYVWYGMLAPTGTPRDIIERLNRDITTAVASPELRDRLVHEGGLPFTGSPEDFGAFVKDDLAQYAKVMHDAKLQLVD
jgi:tripartite-type tricarboxylate transporter receptor subunit TctC